MIKKFLLFWLALYVHMLGFCIHCMQPLRLSLAPCCNRGSLDLQGFFERWKL